MRKVISLLTICMFALVFAMECRAQEQDDFLIATVRSDEDFIILELFECGGLGIAKMAVGVGDPGDGTSNATAPQLELTSCIVHPDDPTGFEHLSITFNIYLILEAMSAAEAAIEQELIDHGFFPVPGSVRATEWSMPVGLVEDGLEMAGIVVTDYEFDMEQSQLEALRAEYETY